MQTKTITFQLATHFLSRIALRIECLLSTIKQACEESHEAIHRYALKNLVEITEIVEKPELKSRFLKEFMRFEYVISKSNTSINNNLLEHLSDQIYLLNHVAGPFGEEINKQHFLKSVRHIQQPNSKECEFSSPQLIMWLDLDPKKRQTEFMAWLELLTDLEETVNIYLSLLRATTFYSTIRALNGYYQYSLSPKIPCHLIQLQIDKSLKLVPKLQVGHHGLTIRLYELLSLKEAKHCSIDMEIAICQL
ncbi:cell division protein ZapD [Legionella israelensis]|uniref:Cell division protein ZapD n=1 Tax=Legionella israelensis TaxID=454 RepID=A0A0W0VP00_9GAMM|nr:cell division protein ZapD [Legionella israelensis]KTD21465.1 Cell division protein ZapD [Legionella israelensis]QBR84200.1 cell division protein ZapD [Legionella israelensis]QBS08460.1 cell division protein ZapD [Legionella israelensis]QDP72696.1 cell division protein ZapD [Legionella israelensis]SCY16151.1 cell division protein ZapD [Legionella israelensis DSM 19235]